MNYMIIVCDIIICVLYAVMAFRRKDKTDRKWDIALSVCWGVAALCNTLALFAQ